MIYSAMGDMNYACYLNVLIFATEWRKFRVTSAQMEFEAFRAALYKDSYVRIDCQDTAGARDVVIFMFSHDSKYIVSNQEMKKLLKEVPAGCHVLLISHDTLTTYHRKYIGIERRIKIQSAHYTNFSMILPKGPLCYPHRILSHAEILQLANNELCSYIIGLPKIYDSDPQCLWIGAQVGDVLEITMYTDMAYEVIVYRVVIPKNGRVLAYRPAEEEPTAEVVDVDEDLADYKAEQVEDEPEEEVEEPE
jgi:DNA-directed RNA polymerase subunit H (RpoH/RPB5)